MGWKREKPEIIIKQQFEFDCCEEPLGVPEILILANRSGFKCLSKYFAELAAREPITNKESWADPDDHQHLPFGWEFAAEDGILNTQVSDRMAFRSGYLTSENRNGVFEKYNISKEQAKHCCLTVSFPGLVSEVEKKLEDEKELQARINKSED